jgi:hypothetical protein
LWWEAYVVDGQGVSPRRKSLWVDFGEPWAPAGNRRNCRNSSHTAIGSETRPRLWIGQSGSNPAELHAAPRLSLEFRHAEKIVDVEVDRVDELCPRRNTRRRREPSVYEIRRDPHLTLTTRLQFHV